MIYDHTHKLYTVNANRKNGAYWYSKELVENIIPYVKTDRDWVTINAHDMCSDHAIVFIHNNLNFKRYEWLSNYKDLILVCGIPETCEKVAHLGTPIYIPLSIDVEYVKQFRANKTRDTAYAGRSSKKNLGKLPKHIDHLENMNRIDLLEKMARYKYVYAVGRTALEAKVLGCEILAYDDRFPDPTVWNVIDNSEVITMLQTEINRIERK